MKKRMKLVQGQKAVITLPVEVKNIDKENYTLTMVASTQDVDRHGDTVLQEGWILDQYQKNPVILDSHNYESVTNIIAKAVRTEVEGNGKKAKLVQDWKFAVNENPKAKIIFELYAGGFASASSVGFIPRKFKENKDGTRDWYTIEEAELLEVSAVSVPANARALAKEKGIDVDQLTFNEDEAYDEEPNGHELPNDNEVQEGNEKNPAENGNGGEGGGGKNNEEGGGTGNEPEVKEPENKETPPAPEPKVEEPVEEKNYGSKVISAIEKIEMERKEKLSRAAKIINSLLEEKGVGPQQIQLQVRKRKVNQAIRILLGTK